MSEIKLSKDDEDVLKFLKSEFVDQGIMSNEEYESKKKEIYSKYKKIESNENGPIVINSIEGIDSNSQVIIQRNFENINSFHLKNGFFSYSSDLKGLI
jgi:hypothetical protein